jgi:hypothetical protein
VLQLGDAGLDAVGRHPRDRDVLRRPGASEVVFNFFAKATMNLGVYILPLQLFPNCSFLSTALLTGTLPNL